MKTIDEIRTFMIQWNNKFPIDSWWRRKHNIAFMSPEHRECSFIAQLMEYEEEQLFMKARQQKEKEEKNEDPYIPNIGQWLKSDNSDEIGVNDIEAFREEARLMYENEE